MIFPPYLRLLISCTIIINCAVIALIAPRIACAKIDSTDSQAKRSGIADFIFNEGLRAYNDGKMQDAAELWEQARSVSVKELGSDHPDTLSTMNSLALSYRELGLHDKALSLQIQTVELGISGLGHDHPSTMKYLNNLSWIYIKLGRFDEAVKYQEQYLQWTRNDKGEDHDDTLRSMQNLAVTYVKLKQADKALTLCEQILSLQRSKFGEEHQETLETKKLFASLLNLQREVKWQAAPEIRLSKDGDRLLDAADSAYAQGLLTEAGSLYEQAHDILIQEVGQYHPATRVARGKLAEIYRTQGTYYKILKLYEQTLSLTRAELGNNHSSTFVLMGDLANMYIFLEMYDDAIALLNQAVELSRAHWGKDHHLTLQARSRLAAAYASSRQYSKAAVIGEEALAEMRTELGADHDDTLSLMNDLAVMYAELAQLDKALMFQEQAVQLQRAKRGNDDDTLRFMDNLAITYRNLGQYDKALLLHDQVLTLSKTKKGYYPNMPNSLDNAARTYSTMNRQDSALLLYEESLKFRRATLGEDHPNTLFSINYVAMSYQAIGKYDKALSLAQALITGAEKLRAMPGLSTEQQQSIFAKYSDDYQLYANWYSQARRPDDGFRTGDLSKARTLTDSIKAQSALRSLPENEQNRLQASQSRARLLLAQQDKLTSTSSTNGDTSTILTLQKEIAALNASHLQLVGDLNSRYPKYAQMNSVPAVDASQAKQLLSGNDAFISYLIHTKGHAQVFVLDQSGIARWVDLGEIKNHASSVAATRELVAPASAGRLAGQLLELKDGGYVWLPAAQTIPKDASVVASDRVTALSLLNRYWHDKLIKPVLTMAGNKSRWIISPDKDLALLPFDVLPETFSGTGETGAPLTTLAQTRNLTLVQSFAVYALLKQRETAYATLQRPKELFAMGNAVYGDGWSENRGMTRGRGEPSFAARNASATEAAITATVAKLPMKPGSEQFAIEQLIWKNLPGTAREVNAVSAVFSNATSSVTKGAGVQQVDSYLGKDASEGKLQELNAAGKLKDYRYLLFSAHGYLAQNPALSSLVLSLQGNPPGIDGHVTASEWPLYDVRSDLTVLSACDTGVGKTQAGESVMGLPYALFVAGNKNTLLSLWPVDDEATAEFMRRFFSKLKAGSTQPNALTETKREFMQHPLWSAPKYWAAFVLYGV